MLLLLAVTILLTVTPTVPITFSQQNSITALTTVTTSMELGAEHGMTIDKTPGPTSGHK